MAKSRDANRGAIIKRPRARLDHKSGGANADADAQLRAQVEFYSKLRDSLFANSDLTAAQAVDTVALAVLADVATFPAELGQVVVLLPPPESTTQRPLPRHDLFSPPVASLRPPKRPATRSSTDSKPSATKKRRGSKDQDEDSDKCRLELPDDCPREIRRDIHRLFKTAAEQGKLPYRIAYPWAGQRAWYDPQKYPGLYLVPWRYWMRHRPTFFDCTLYAPSEKSEARRKSKSNAVQGRLILISMNVMTFGWYGFPELSKAKAGSTTPSQTDLATLFRTDRFRYDRILARALDPYHIDEDGYQSIPELLRPWLASSTTFMAASRPTQLAAKLQKGAYEVPGEEKPFKPKEQGGDDSDFVDDEDTFAVLPPTAPVTGSYPFTSSEEEDEADELEDKRSAPPADEADGDQEDDDQGDLHEDDDEHSPGTGDQSRADQDDSPVPSMGSTTSKSAAKSK
ncbi:hypothetical protein PR003_g15573 [Phytophthora rubi]|uniref:Uncharacterized protein n=1 Tax=Phytophthora rubi TaxID=129364 RepID=A0A6A4ENV4_9STRA|nr:hypothetical protein PR001_g13677 [Phytophthora rubi]KAE9329376.1 hypothetical protein PR003_g15573 [Phytophthora rubi]